MHDAPRCCAVHNLRKLTVRAVIEANTFESELQSALLFSEGMLPEDNDACGNNLGPLKRGICS